MLHWKRNAYRDRIAKGKSPPNMHMSRIRYLFPATVMLEGTELSEGRGTTGSRTFTHPAIEPWSFLDKVKMRKL